MKYLDWQQLFDEQLQQDYYLALSHFLESEYAQGKVIYPPKEDMFTAFDLTALDKVKVVILGQDPYHGAGQAHGLCFSVKGGVKIPPSLVNIYKELKQDIDGFEVPTHGNLTSWADQGILLLNTVLTVEESKAHSHSKAGWELFTDKVMQCLNERDKAIIFVFWGAHAIKKGRWITAPQHHILSGPHPSPLSAYRGFFGCKHFSTINELLVAKKHTPINWQV
ncbi:uracil-DNA glycosylase [Shewanella donghaensis]|uniref:uracil-DNA glycosylase n=1 Tax=Shewanella donghaensis TaxID=238836 RepID=UPI001182D1FC|nr:uracil-DNA glycosylase [Shewanella donghaensis]